MSKNIFFVSVSVLKLTRETTIRGTRWIPGVAEQRLSTPVVFTAAFLESFTSSLVLTLVCARVRLAQVVASSATIETCY